MLRYRHLTTLTLLFGCVAPLAAQPLGQPDRGSPGDEMIQAYLAQETAKLAARFADDVKSLRGVGGEAAAVRRGVLLHARPLAAAGEDAAGGDGHRHAQGRRLRRRDAALSEPAGAVRHGQPLSAGGREGGREAAGGLLCLRPLAAAAATATRSPFSRTASGSPGTATSAWSSIRCSSARSPRSTTARTTSTAGGGTRAATRPPASRPGTASAASTTSSAGRTSIRSGSPSPASAAAGRRRSGSPRPTSA